LQPDRYTFGPYQLRTRTRELFKSGTKLKVRPQVVQLLLVLLEHGGDVVTREELRQTLWPARTFVDFEHGLNTSIRELRSVLSDSAGQPRYIQTLPKIGYRLLASVEAEPARHVVNGGAPAFLPQPPLAARIRPVFQYVAVAALLPVVLLGWMILGGRPQYPSMPAPLTSLRGSAQFASWSPGGRQLAFAWKAERQGRYDIYVSQPPSSQTLRLTTGPGDNLSPAWSPDGKWIAYVHSESRWGRSSLELLSPLGGPPRTVMTSASAMGRISWLPDSRAVVLEIKPEPQQPVSLWVVWIDAGHHRPLTTPPPGIPGDTGPAVSPDGRTVAFCRATFWRTSELYLLNLRPDLSPAGPERRVTNLGSVRWPAWTPDGKSILFDAECEGAALCRADVSGGPPQPVFGLPSTASQAALVRRPGRYTSLAFTNTVAETGIWRYSAAAPAASPPVELAASIRSQASPRYSPDGRRLAFASDRTGYQEIWIADAEGSQARQLTDLHHLLTETPEWSPAGGQIAFLSQQGADRQIYLADAAGGPATAVTHEEGIASLDGWTRDGSAFYYTSTRSGRPEVWRISPSGASRQQVTTGGGVCGFDTGRGIFYYWKGKIADRAVLMQRTPAGDEPVRLATAGISCRTSPSPSGFYFRSEDGDIYLYREGQEKCERFPVHPERPFTSFTVSPQGNWLAISSDVKENSNLMLVERFQ